MSSTDLAVKPLAFAAAAIAPLGKDRLAQLSALHLYGMAAAWSELLAEGPRRPMQPEAWLDRLIEAELADRQVRSLRYPAQGRALPRAPRPDRHRMG
jgi:hypothetical protein